MRISIAAGAALLVMSVLAACNSSNTTVPATVPTATSVTTTAPTAAPTATPQLAPPSLTQQAVPATAQPVPVPFPSTAGIPFNGTLTLPSTLAPAGTQIILTEKTGSAASLAHRRNVKDALGLYQIDIQVSNTTTFGGVPGMAFNFAPYASAGVYIKTIDAVGNVTVSPVQALDASGNLNYLGTTAPFILAPSQVYSIVFIPSYIAPGSTPAPGLTPDPLQPGVTPVPTKT